MKVHIGSYRPWIGPFQIAQMLLFWRNKEDDTVYKLGDKLAGIRWLTRFCVWVDSKKNRNIKVKIHDYDTWNMDTTLAHIIVPMLKQLKAAQHGAPIVDPEDAPQFPVGHLDDDGNDEFYFDRWNYVMDEMIFAFESKLTDWEDQFWIRQPQMDLSKYTEDEGSFASPIRWFDVGKCDYEGMKQYQDRMQNGFRLFGKYYEGLWD